MKRSLLAFAAALACGCVFAQSAVQGQPAPATVLDQIKHAPLTRIGSQSVRAIPAASIAGKQAGAGDAGQTLVVRESDKLVGISANELVIISPALDAIAAKVASLQLPGTRTHSYPKLQLLIVKTARFEQLETVRDQVAAAFPEARFDLPITYFAQKAR